MTRKILAAILALAMVFALCLTACGNEQAEAEDTTKAAEKETTKAAEKETTAAGTDEEEFALETVHWYNWIDMSTKQDWADYVWPELERYFLETINVEAVYHGFPSSEYAAKFQAAITANTDIDLLGMGSASGFYVWYERNTLEPMDDLLAEYAPQLLEDVPDYALKATTIDGKIYGVATIKDLAVDNGLFYNETMIDYTGLTDEFNAVDFRNAKDFDEFFHDLLAGRNEAKPEWSDYPLLSVNTSRETYIKCDTVVRNLIMAKINDIDCLNDEAEDGGIVLYKTKDYSDMIHLVYNWVQDGINPYDSQNYQTTDIMNEGVMLGRWSYGEMCANRDKYAEYGWTLELRHPKYSFTYTNYPLASVNGINALTTDSKKVAAMRLYNLLAEDPYVVTTMHCGVENIHWQKMTDEAGRTRANFDFEGSRNADPTAYGYKQWYFASTGNLSIMWLPSDEAGEFVDIMNSVNGNALTSQYMGFLFKTTATENEIAACANVVDEYNKDLMYGMIDDIDGRIDAFNAALEANGVQIVLDDVNAQMTEWLAAQ